MAQAFRRLGSTVDLIDAGTPLAHADPDAAALLLATLRAEGIAIHPHTAIDRIAPGPTLHLATGQTLTPTHLLVATGRTPNTDTLALSHAGLTPTPDGLEVDRSCRTKIPHIYAIGDCRAGPRLTHLAAHEATIAIQNIALGLPAKTGSRIPQVIYTDPELAQLGPTAAQTPGATTQTTPFAADDRAIAEADPTGFLKLTLHKGRPTGVTIIAPHAGDLLLPWSQILAGKASRFALSGTIVAYPTRSERSKAAAFDSLRPLLFHPALKAWARLLARTRRIP